MTADPHRVKELFIAVLDLSDAQARQAFLERECGADADLRQRLEALLKAHDDPASVLDRPLAAIDPLDPGATNSEAPAGGPAEDAGTVIAGRYKLLEQIGEGGMGTVWVAEQTQPVRRKVALKLIKAGMDSKSVLSRFEAERQALALMDHPNIAKVLDGGTTESGRPFFVMEYVKGVPFTRYCDDARLSIAERLALFVAICQAVQHAHQKGIIHRDLKPSNLLICLYDGKPVPKVIDFGLAKAMHQPLTEHTLHTAHGAMMGTPLYMSPEQAEFNNLDVDTRTDIYALGVILYELLTGTTPLEKQQFQKAAWQEILRLIKEEEPPRPSARLSGSGSLPSLAAQRQLEPIKLTKLVRGELDWIVMKCLEKDRSRRYDTATGLARDVERYLADEVVEARPPSAGYRLRKFVRRHRAGLAMAAMVLLLLAAGVAVTAWQAVRARRAEREAMQARDRAVQSENEAKLLQKKAQEEEQKARKSAAEARAIIGFFKAVTLEARRTVQEGDRWRRKTVDETVAIIDSKKIRTLFANHPLAEAEIREWLATAAILGPTGGFSTLKFPGWPKGKIIISGHPMFRDQKVQIEFDPDTARRHLERAVKLRATHLGPNNPRTLATLHQLGQTIAQVDAHEAIHVLGDLVGRSNATLGPDNSDSLEYKASLAETYEQAGRLEDAILLRKDVYMLTKNKLGADHNNTLNCSDHLAAACEKAGRIQDALRQREESLRGRRQEPVGSNDLGVGYALQEVARLHEKLHDYARAEPLWREALPLLKTNENVLIDVQESLARCLLHMGKPAQAEPVLRQSLALREKKEPGLWTTFSTKSLLGRSLLEQKKYADAEPLLLAGYEGIKKATDGNDAKKQARLIEGLQRLVQLYEAMNKKDKADTWQKELQEAKNAVEKPAKP